MSRRLMEPMTRPPVDDQPAEFPFGWTPAHSTDVSKTWDKLCPGWRNRKPGDEQPKVSPIQKARRK